MGQATLERVAACAVLAGCLPAYFPVVQAAVEAELDPAFNFNGQAVTTVLVAECPTDGPGGPVLRWASRVLGAALVACGVILVLDGVLNV